MDRALNTPKPVRKWHPSAPEEAANPARPAPKAASAPVVRKPKPRSGSVFPRLAPKIGGSLPGAAQATSPVAENPEFGPAPRLSALHNFGLICVAGFILSSYSNDMLMHMGAKAYLSWVFGPLEILALLICGTVTRGVQARIGKLWLAFAVCLLFSTAFSIFKTQSLQMIEYYFPRTLVLYFCCTAFALTVRNVHKLMMLNVICTAMMILEAILFGQPDDSGRLIIANSNFLGNSNDFALNLVCSLGFSMYLVFQKSGILKMLGGAQFLLTLYFMLKTGSRGGFLGLVGCLTIWFLFSGKRGTIIALLLPALAVIPMVSSDTLARLVHIEAPASIGAGAQSEAEQSQVQRQQMLELSVHFALTHPLFGTGPDTFQTALYNMDVTNGTHTPSFGTHNAWTQVASDCGFPAFFCYVFIVFGSIRMCYRIMRKTQKQPGAEKVFAISASLLGILVAYAVSTTFDHVAYHLSLPLFSGMAAALYLSTHGGDLEWIRSQDALGNV